MPINHEAGMKKQAYSTSLVGKLAIWQYGLWSFQTGGTKLERFLPKDSDNFRHRKLTLNVKFWHFWALFDTHPLIQCAFHVIFDI